MIYSKDMVLGCYIVSILSICNMYFNIMRVKPPDWSIDKIHNMYNKIMTFRYFRYGRSIEITLQYQYNWLYMVCSVIYLIKSPEDNWQIIWHIKNITPMRIYLYLLYLYHYVPYKQFSSSHSQQVTPIQTSYVIRHI